jgi:hypothetical protein
MKRLVEESEPAHEALTELVAGARRYEPNPFAKRLVHSRLTRALAGESRSGGRRLAWLGLGGLFVATSAAAAGYSLFVAPDSPRNVPIRLSAVPLPQPTITTPPRRTGSAPEPVLEPAPSVEKLPERRADKPRAGEDPSQVAEAVRALRKEGDPARAQRLLDQYLRSNPRGALAEDALALSIEASAARKDPRAAEYARRYLARYPQGRFRSLAERVATR